MFTPAEPALLCHALGGRLERGQKMTSVFATNLLWHSCSAHWRLRRAGAGAPAPAAPAANAAIAAHARTTTTAARLRAEADALVLKSSGCKLLSSIRSMCRNR